jgi:hypothetical protein
MIKFYTTLISVLFLFSCATKISYLGNVSSPTQNVDVFVDRSAIKKTYTIVGKGYVEQWGYTRTSLNKIQAKAIAQAKSKGADAVLFEDYYVSQEGTGIRTTTTTDSVGKGLVTVTNGYVGPVISSGRNIFFLKYEY